MSDLINRLRGHSDFGAGEDPIDGWEVDLVRRITKEAAETIESLTSENTRLRALMKWISVEDRLPDLGIKVLVFRPLAKETNDPIMCLDHRTEGYRKSPQGISHSFQRWCHPTHWLPIPPPPGDEQ